MEADSGITIKELRVDGGATANNLLMQFQADILKAKVVRPQMVEVTAIGAAYLAGLGIGYWNSVEDIQQQWEINKIFEPDTESDKEDLIKGWHKAVKGVKAWTEL